MEEQKIYQCKLCSLLFARSPSLAVHVRFKHRNEEYPKRTKVIGSSRCRGQPRKYVGSAIARGLSVGLRDEQPPHLASVNAPLLGSVLDIKFIEARPQFFHPTCLVHAQDEVIAERNTGGVDLELRLGFK